jgi:hypothetical protein
LARIECPAGTTPERDVTVAAFAAGATGGCAPALRAEPTAELLAMHAQLAARSTGGYPVKAGAFESAVAQHQAIARQGAAAPHATWIPVGKGPLNADVPGYSSTNGLGLNQLAGRVEDLAHDPANAKHWFAAFASGGVWESKTAGSSWTSVGDNLPTQVTGAVAYLATSPAKTLLVGTGDPAYGGSSFPGLGVFRSTNDGRSWTKADGVPSGALTFAFGYDPSKPSVVYAATSKGLYRSTNSGRSFRNVGLPTGCTNVKAPLCFFANMVTDVVVRPSDRNGTNGGGVLAVVGWRAGAKANAQGKPQSPHNGLYHSSSGAPGSFRYMSNPSGFATDDAVARTALAVAVGPRQNHDYVYALVQDAKKFNHGATVMDLPDASGGQVPSNTILNGLYGSTDFGATWVKLADAAQLALPGSGSALSGPLGATYAPGLQSWYNEWVSVDPTTQDEAGVPGRIAFGLEEVWTGSGAILPVPNTGQYHVVGRYFSGNTCGGFGTAILQGYCPFSATPTKPQGATTHPDQHAGMWVPTESGGVTLVAGNDGGVYKQPLASGQQLDNDNWSKGSQNGFHTLLPYDAGMAADGTVVQGLQDNGSSVITPDGKQIMAFGGDGFWVAIDPDNSHTWWSEVTYGDLRVTTDGGKNWTTKTPADTTGALFSTPLVMDATDAGHLITGGRYVWETTRGAAVSSWNQVYDLGTRSRPGNASAAAADGNPNNSLSAVDTRGDATYVGFCGYCDIVTGGLPFGSGLATNVGGGKDPRANTGDGWHIAKAAGLPKRYINSVRIDPKSPRIVYVTLGGYGRRWIPPGSLGDDVSEVGRGHVFRSTDAGATFKDISGNLPDIGADDAFPFRGGLVVATDLGVYFSSSVTGGRYSVLGKGLPAAPVFRLNRSPRNSTELVAASYGRGVYRIVVAAGASASRAGTSAGQAASAKGQALPGHVVASRATLPAGRGFVLRSARRAFDVAAATVLGLTALLLPLLLSYRYRRREARMGLADPTAR